VQNIASGMIPRICDHPCTITAELMIPGSGADGVIVAEPDHLGGFSLSVADGKLRHTYSMMGVQVCRQESDAPLPAGEVTVRLDCQLGICAGMGVMGLSWQLMYPPAAVAPWLAWSERVLHTISIPPAQCLHMPAAVLRCSGACYHWTIKRRR
jgi:hypothetical protein